MNCACMTAFALCFFFFLGMKLYLALATHSMMASFLPTVTLVFLGGMMIEGAMGSAGPPTSIRNRNT